MLAVARVPPLDREVAWHQIIPHPTTIMPGSRVQAIPAAARGALAAIQVHGLIGTTPVQVVHGIIQAPEVHGVTLRLEIHPLGVPEVADSLGAVDSVVAVVAAAMQVVADTEDDKIIRSSFYSI